MKSQTRCGRETRCRLRIEKLILYCGILELNQYICRKSYSETYFFLYIQMTIFGVLFKFWPQFCEFRKNLTDEKIMSVLERRQEHKQKRKASDTEEDKAGKVRASPSHPPQAHFEKKGGLHG